MSLAPARWYGTQSIAAASYQTESVPLLEPLPETVTMPNGKTMIGVNNS